MAQSVALAKSSRFIILASIFIVVAALYLAQVVLIPLALAILLSFLLAPLVNELERWRLGRVPSVILVTTIVLAAIVGVGWIVVVQVLNLAKNLPQYQDNIVSHVRDLRGRGGGTMEEIGKNVAELGQKLSEPTTQEAAKEPETKPAATQPTTVVQVFAQYFAEIRQREEELDRRRRAAGAATDPSQLPGGTPQRPLYTQDVPPPRSPLQVLGDNISVVLEPLATAGLVIVFVIFMLLQREDLRDRVIRLVGKGQIHLTTTALDDAATRISRYLLAMAIVNGTYGLAIAIGLWVIGRVLGDGTPFPSVVLWGLLCALLRFIPYIGPWIAAAFPIALSFAVYEGYAPFFATVIMFVVVELLSNNFMEPLLYGSSTGMSTLAIVVAAVFWTWLWGPIGLLLATPMTVCFVVLGKHVPQMQFLDILLGDEPVLELPDRVYQRLLALDQEEAAELAQAYMKDTSLERVYDEVLLPALAMAEHDRHRGRLGEDRETFISHAMRDMIEELGDAARAADERRDSADLREAAAANVDLAKGRTPTTTSPTAPGGNGRSGTAGGGGSASISRPTLPKDCTINVVCLPAHDEGDDIANLMLAQLLALRGYCSVPIPVAALASEMLDAIEKHGAHIVVVSALPPGAVSYSRYLCKRLHMRYPDLPKAVGLWTFKGDLKKAKDRITCAADVQVATTLSTTVDMIHQMVQPMIVRQESASS